MKAMRMEVKGFLDKMLFHPVHPGDISEECNKHILNSLSAYEDRIGKPAGKARVLVDGSKQLDEIVGDSYCPVTRNETIMKLLAVGAHRGWKIASKDVKQAYTKVKRPANDPYRYVRLSKDVTKVAVDLDPGMARFVDKRAGTFMV